MPGPPPARRNFRQKSPPVESFACKNSPIKYLCFGKISPLTKNTPDYSLSAEIPPPPPTIPSEGSLHMQNWVGKEKSKQIKIIVYTNSEKIPRVELHLEDSTPPPPQNFFPWKIFPLENPPGDKSVYFQKPNIMYIHEGKLHSLYPFPQGLWRGCIANHPPRYS